MKASFVEYLYVLLNPNYWIQIHDYSKEWDRKLNYLLEHYSFENVGRYKASLGDEIIWIANHPFASFTKNDERPKRITIYKAKKKLDEDTNSI